MATERFKVVLLGEGRVGNNSELRDYILYLYTHNQLYLLILTHDYVMLYYIYMIITIWYIQKTDIFSVCICIYM